MKAVGPTFQSTIQSRVVPIVVVVVGITRIDRSVIVDPPSQTVDPISGIGIAPVTESQAGVHRTESVATRCKVYVAIDATTVIQRRWLILSSVVVPPIGSGPVGSPEQTAPIGAEAINVLLLQHLLYGAARFQPIEITGIVTQGV